MQENLIKGTSDTTKFAYWPTLRPYKEQEFKVCNRCYEYLGKEEKCRKCKKSFNEKL